VTKIRTHFYKTRNKQRFFENIFKQAKTRLVSGFCVVVGDW